MGDLISRKAVYEMLHGLGGCDATDEWADGWDKGINQAVSDLEDIPTAYDVDKVVERLEFENKRLKTLKNNCIALCDHEVIGIKSRAYNYAIEIVKRGGRDE